jgi:endonuclease/exonuclease/phosphatase family metal-dependent hydrolase
MSLHLITWNIQWARGCDGRVDPARIARTALAFADADVLCLQEVAVNYPELPGSRGEDQVAALAQALPGYAPAFVATADVLAEDGGRRRFGNLILSRLPLLRVFRHLLPWPCDGTGMQRGLVEAVVAAPFGPLRVMTTHLEYYSAAQRAAQVERIRELHAEACAHGARGPRAGAKDAGPFRPTPRPASAVLTGDFNFRPEDPLLARLCAGFDDGTPALHDAWRACHPGRPHAPTVGVHDRAQWPQGPFCCDFICVSADLVARIEAVEVDAATDASDHQPVLLSLR